MFSSLAFRWQENNVIPTMPEDCASMKLGVAYIYAVVVFAISWDCYTKS